SSQVLVMVEDDPGQVSADFGVVQAAGPVALSKTIKIVNKGAAGVRYALAYQPITTMPGVRYELSSSSIEVGPRQAGTVTVTLRIDDPSALHRTPDPTIETLQRGAARQFLPDASGRVVLTPVPGAPPLRVPVYAAPRPVAGISVPERLSAGGDRRAVLTLSGRGVDQGTGAAAYRSLISVLELQAESAQLPECEGPILLGCTPNGTATGGDIRYVGVMSTAPLARGHGRPQDALLAFGITTWGEWYNVGSNIVPFIDIDTTGDGLPDFEVRAMKLPGTDVLVAATMNLRAPPGAPPVAVLPVNGQFGDVDSGVFDSDVILLPVTLTALGIDPSAITAPIRYTAGTLGFYPGPVSVGAVIDSTAPAIADAVRPAVWAEGAGDPAVTYLARPGTALIVNRDPLAARPARLLVLHPGNPSGHRVQLVRVPGVGSDSVDGPVVPVPVPAPLPRVARPAGRLGSGARSAGP
ncbi:MAG TPA: peptidase S8, partial [Pseudonocardiaceae bacterium]|nr:peptidase S8 [Pseudonocardiaceae bacterium]